MARVCRGCLSDRDLGRLFDLVIKSCVMGPNNQKDGKRKSNTGGAKNQTLSPYATGRGFIGEASADARQERGRNIGVDCGAHSLINRRKERLFPGECSAARGTDSEVRAQFALKLTAGGRGFD